MTTKLLYQVCQYHDETHLQAIVDLINICRAADNLENRTTLTRLHESFTDPLFDIQEDLRLWFNADNELVAVGSLWRLVPEQEAVGILGFDLHPQVRGDALGDEVIAWATSRMQTAGQGLGLPLVLHSGCRDTVETRRSLLFQAGFSPTRYFLRLQRSLQSPIAKSFLPEGWRIRSVRKDDAEKWVETFNQTFIDHWNHTPATVDKFHHWTTRTDYDPNLDLVVETDAGQIAAFCYSEIDPERNAHLGIQEGHVCLLGTRRGYRRLGLARTLLTESLWRLQLLGMTTATIGVDAQNPLGAVKLYTSVGFEREHSSTVFRKVVG